MWDLPVHGGLDGIGLDASGFSIDTENSSNSEHVSVLYTKRLMCLNLKVNSHLNITGDMCLFVSYGHTVVS